MTTRIYTPKDKKKGGARCLEYIVGDCLENAGLVIPHGGIAIIDCSCEVRVGDLVRCDNAFGTIHGFIKQVKEIGDTIIVETNYIDPDRNFSFEASVIYGVVTEVFDKFNGTQIYRRETR